MPRDGTGHTRPRRGCGSWDSSERLVWNLRLSPVWGGGFGEAARNTLPPEGQWGVPGLSPWMKQPRSDTQLRHLSPRNPGKSPRDFKSQGPLLWAGETGSTTTRLWGLRVSSFWWHLPQSALSQCGLYEDHEFFFHGSNTCHTQLLRPGIKHSHHPWTSAAYFIP